MRALALLALLATSLPSQAGPVPNVYTYQGELRENGVPRNGTVDLRFRIHDAAVGGVQYDLVKVDDVPLTDGLFTALVPLDSAVFLEGGSWWLSVDIRDGLMNGAEPYVAMDPRQPIGSVPYATNAQAVGGLDTTVLLKMPGLGAYKRGEFSFTQLAAPGQPAAALVSLTAKVPADGQLVFRSRGYCRLTPAFQDTELSGYVSLGDDVNDAIVNVPFHGSTLLLAARSAPSDMEELLVPFTAERAYPVVANQLRSLALFGKRVSGAGSFLCSGSISAEFFPGSL